MKSFPLVLLPLLALSFRVGNSLNLILHSPRVTNWGNWGPWQKCAEEEFVVGMRIKSESLSDTTKDNTAMNGVQFLCAEPGRSGENNVRETAITSSYGDWGTWGDTFKCAGEKGVVTGFQLRSQRSRGSGLLGAINKDFDDTAANNLRIVCYNQTIIEGDGTNWGSWTTPQYCKPRQAVCGVQTQVEPRRGRWRDDTALNNIDVECCDLPNNF